MLTKTAAFTLACATGLITTAVSAEEAPAGESSPHSTSGFVTFATNYVVRGLSQTNFKPAVQGAYEYAHASGFYTGLFASNVSWYGDAWEAAAPGQSSAIYGGTTGDTIAISNSMEIDLYAGFRGKVTPDFSYDVGGIYYYYPGQYAIASNQAAYGVSKPNTGEVYGSVGWKFINAKLSYAVTDGVFGVSDARGSYYSELNAIHEIGDTGFSALAHVGYWKFDGAMRFWADNQKDNSVYDLTDWKLGVTKDFVGVTFGAFYTGSTAKEHESNLITQTDPYAVWGNRYGKNVGDTAFFLTATKAF